MSPKSALAIPAAAGRELYNLHAKRGGNLPFIIPCVLLLNCPLVFAPQF